MSTFGNKHGTWDSQQRLTKNFVLGEFLWGAKSFIGNAKYKQLAITSFTPAIYEEIKKLAAHLQKLRDFIGVPITISAGYRPTKWEKLQGRKGDSKHALGQAADIVVLGISPNKIYDRLNTMFPDCGLGIYPTWVHFDICTNPKMRRWKG